MRILVGRLPRMIRPAGAAGFRECLHLLPKTHHILGRRRDGPRSHPLPARVNTILRREMFPPLDLLQDQIVPDAFSAVGKPHIGGCCQVGRATAGHKINGLGGGTVGTLHVHRLLPSRLPLFLPVPTPASFGIMLRTETKTVRAPLAISTQTNFQCT